MKNTPPGQTVTSDDATNGPLAAVSPADHMAPMTGRFTAQAAAIVPDRCAGVVADGPGREMGRAEHPASAPGTAARLPQRRTRGNATCILLNEVNVVGSVPPSRANGTNIRSGRGQPPAVRPGRR